MALDLGIANAPLVWTVPQADFEGTPPSLTLIEEDQAEEEASSPAQGPVRAHRMAMAPPGNRARGTASERLRAGFAWRRDTLDALVGLPLGLSSTLGLGVLDRDSYLLFFGGAAAGFASGPYLYHVPSSGYSLWGARYVIMPVSSNGWIGVNGGLERLYPSAAVVGDAEQARRWIDREDWQLARNQGAYPRAWLVHSVFVHGPTAGPNDPGRLALMRDLVYQTDRLWREQGRPILDLRTIAFVETDQPRALAGYTSRTAVGRGESVTVTRYEPQRVEIVAELRRPGLVVLADRFDPGWFLTIDGTPAPIFRTNRLMRGAAVKAGRHTLVYTYDPASFRIGAGISVAGLVGLAAVVFWGCKDLRGRRGWTGGVRPSSPPPSDTAT
jgi:hypothetical protein